MTKEDLKVLSTQVLAFYGDAVYEKYVRQYLVEKDIRNADRLSAEAVKYVRAEAQAVAYDGIQDILTEEEASVGRRAKNHKITSMPHNVDPRIYKKATALEALLGFADLAGDPGRVAELAGKAVQIIEETDIRISRR